MLHSIPGIVAVNMAYLMVYKPMNNCARASLHAVSLCWCMGINSCRSVSHSARGVHDVLAQNCGALGFFRILEKDDAHFDLSLALLRKGLADAEPGSKGRQIAVGLFGRQPKAVSHRASCHPLLP